METVSLFGMQIHRATMTAAVDQLLAWCWAPRQGQCMFVVTPNVDHVVMYQRRGDLRRAYNNAALVLADGAPVVWASRIVGRGLPERVAGSDLVPALFTRAKRMTAPLRVFLLGAAPGIAEQAGKNIEARWPNVQVVGTHSPPLGFEHDDAENQRILKLIADTNADLLVVGLGAPKQELWLDRFAGQITAKVALGVGATIDFLAGHRTRSPLWMRRAGLEWLHRVATEPRRLAARYARDAWLFPQLLWRELRNAHV